MNEKKLKSAFWKIKSDMDVIHSHLNGVKSRVKRQEEVLELSREIKKDIDYLKKIDLASFVKNLEKEVDTINDFILNMSSRTEEMEKIAKSYNSQISKLDSDIKGIKKKIGSAMNETQNTNLDMKVLNEHTAEFEMMIDEKVTLENSNLKLEIDTKLARLASDIDKISREVEKSKKVKQSPEVNLEEFGELINEQVQMQLAAAKMEIYEQVMEMINSGKDAKIPKTSSKNVSVTKKSKSKGESKVKKAVKWLFVDEDEEELLNDVKADIKKKENV